MTEETTTLELNEPEATIALLQTKADALEVGLNALIAALCATAPQAIAPLRKYLALESSLTHRLPAVCDGDRRADQHYQELLENYQTLLQRIEENRHH